MVATVFWSQLESRLGKFDLLCHPFYQAWSAGQLTRQDLAEYASDYYPHVAGFPAYLHGFAGRLPEGELKQAVLENAADEEGAGAARSHAELWLDFAEGVGASRAAITNSRLLPKVAELTSFFHDLARSGDPAEVLAGFYAYESQVPRLAAEKAQGLRSLYGADNNTRRYFTLHSTADVHHANVWKRQLDRQLQQQPGACGPALHTAEEAARRLWCALDGIERQRQARAAAAAARA